MLLFPRYRRRNWSIGITAMIALVLASSGAVAGPRADKKKNEPKAEQGLKSIPLPIGQEAKGMVLPDFDMQGHIRGRFEAAVVKRVDEVHVQFSELKMMTYTPEEKPDLQINTSDSILDLDSRVLTSRQRTTVKRADFEIAGDTMQFNTTTREGKLSGNVKMLLLNQSTLVGKKEE